MEFRIYGANQYWEFSEGDAALSDFTSIGEIPSPLAPEWIRNAFPNTPLYAGYLHIEEFGWIWIFAPEGGIWETHLPENHMDYAGQIRWDSPAG